MNILDIVILLLFLPGVIRGLSRGFVEQAVSLAGIVLSVWAAFNYRAALALRLKDHIQVNETVLNVISFAIILVVVMIVVIALAKIITKVIQMASLGWLNKVLGVVVAIALSAIIIGVIAILFDTVNTKFQLVTSPVLTESVLYNSLKDFGYTVFPYLKQLFTPETPVTPA